MAGSQMVRAGVVAAMGSWLALLGATAPSASAEPPAPACADVDVVFARATGEVPGYGVLGQPLVDAIRAQVGAKTVSSYAVNYAASADFVDREAFAQTIADGVRDEGDHIKQVAADCPNTRIVLSGYSQGASLTSLTTADVVPAGIPANVPNPLPKSVVNHVAAVVLFGNPSPQLLASNGAPKVVVGSRFTNRTLQLCAPGDTVCQGEFTGSIPVEHLTYLVNGMVGEAATYAVSKL